MTILQPQPASKAVLEGQEFYRINQPAVNNGDLFRLDQSVRAIVVGPESDFAEYTIWYYDPLKKLRVNLGSVTSDQPWLGRLDARMTDLYTDTNQAGAIYVAPKDLYIPGFFFPVTPPGVKTVFAPNIDLICYFTDPSQIPDKRPTRRISSAIRLGAAVNRIFLPVYGRKSFSVRVVYADPALNVQAIFDVVATGLKFMLPAGNTFSNSLGSFETIGPSASIAPKALGNNVGLTYDAEAPAAFGPNAARGRFDYVEIDIEVDVGVDPSTVLQGGAQILLEAND